MLIDRQDKYDGHYPERRFKWKYLVKEWVSKFFKFFDLFWVRVQLVPRGSGSICGVIATLLIVLLSLLTFGLTISNMNSFQYQVDKQFLQVGDVSFKGVTGEKLNVMVCSSDNSYLVGYYAYISLNFFTVIDGVMTKYAPVQMVSGDNTFNINNQFFYYDVTNCFRMAYDIPIVLDSRSYFGYTLTPYCSGTNSYCSTIGATKFVDSVNEVFLETYLPSNAIDFNSTTFRTDYSDIISGSINSIKYTVNTRIVETVLAEVVQIKDNAGNQFMHGDSRLVEQQIDVNVETSKWNIRAWEMNSPSYVFQVKPSQSRSVFTLSQRKIDFILGVIGGVFVFWYAIVRFIGHAYNRLNFSLVVAREIYDEQVYDYCFATKLLAALRIPICLVPNCCGLRADVARMKGLKGKIDRSLNHLGMVKYTDIVYQLSSSFFGVKAAKNLSQIYLKEKINEAAKCGGMEQSENVGDNRFVQSKDEI